MDEPWFRTLRGNHEEMCIRSPYDLHIRDIQAPNGGGWFYLLSQIQQLEIIERFKQLHLVIEVQLEHKKMGVLHADIGIHDWNAFKQNIRQGEYKIAAVCSAYNHAFWGRGRIRNNSEH